MSNPINSKTPMDKSNLTCPYCQSLKIMRHGFSVRKSGEKLQRYWCNECDRTFTLKNA
ncbi:transposase [Calothrix sp. NIES-2100]|uniref:transposase n=1 Tax=Calothrix sp. NIES-2100 TaxID=1954172 RepID=UPI00403F0CB9